jgi:tetratricopeptide (TPR) repeat protein
MRKAFVRTALSFFLAASSLASMGCGAGAGAGSRYGSERATAPGVAVTDAAFAGAVRDLLVSEPGSRERSMRLAGVEAKQLSRAAARFRAHSAERGVAAVTGGLYLVRTGELHDGMLGPSGREALSAAVKELSSRGDEGRARALYEILLRISPDADKKDIQGHLDALGNWMKDTAGKTGSVHNARELASIAVARRLLEPSDAALQEASLRSTQWVQSALALRNTLREKRVAPPREEGMEAFVALQSGGRTLAALHLVGVDAVGAVHAIDRAQAREFGAHDLIEALERAADKPSAATWLEVLHALRPGSSREARDEEDMFEDKELFRAAAWAVAIEAYRLDPTVPESAGAVAAGLQEYGMAEASPAVLIAAARAHPEARTLGGALAIVMHAMAMEVEAEDVDAARRAYNAAAPLLALVEGAKMGARAQPSAGNVRAMMGEIELREGHVAAARSLLQSASNAEKSGGVLATLGRIERFDGQLPAAVGHLKEALTTQDAVKDPALRGEIGLVLGDIAVEQNNPTAARGHYTDALKELARARTQGEPEDRARVERVLSRVLDRFGALSPAKKALERAYDDAPRDKQQVSATLGLIVGRALVHSDLPTARDGLRRALSADLEQDELIYLALWVRLLERQLKAQPEGTTEKVFSSIIDDGRWVGRLAAFGGGRLRADQLIASAKTPAQKTEALFYAAMDRRVSGDQQAAEAALKQVLKSGGIDLMEVALTRDILNGARAAVPGPLPEVGLP